MDVEAGNDRGAALGAGDEPDVPHAGSERGEQWSRLVPPVRRDDHGGGVGGNVVTADELVAERLTDADERPGDRAVTDDGHQRRRTMRLEEDLQRAAAEAWVVRRQLAGHGILGRRADPQQDGLAGVEHGERLRPHGRLGAVAADEALHRAVGEHERLIAGVCARRPLGEHHLGVHERHARRPQLGRPVPDHPSVCVHPSVRCRQAAALSTYSGGSLT